VFRKWLEEIKIGSYGGAIVRPAAVIRSQQRNARGGFVEVGISSGSPADLHRRHPKVIGKFRRIFNYLLDLPRHAVVHSFTDAGR
jgi:hypothetical protein